MTDFDQQLAAELSALREADLLRQLRCVESPAGTRASLDGRELLNFSSNDYLGLASHPALKEAAIKAVEKWGAGSGASRLVCGSLAVHHELEEALADFKGTEAALTFSTGYAAAQGAIVALLGKGDILIVDKLIHACVVDAAKVCGAKLRVFRHNDLNDLEAKLKWARKQQTTVGDRRSARILIVTESVFSMDGDLAPLRNLVELKDRHGAWLMVDEAHALGVVGTRGHGMHEYYGIDPNEVDIWMGTLSKTLSACGGYIAGNASLIEWLKHSAPGFVYSVGLAPALAAAALESLAIMHAEPERVARLHANAALFLGLAREAGFDTGTASAHAIIPVILGSSIAAARYSQLLLARGINVQPIIYPAVAEKAARLRFFISSEHTDADIRATIAALIAIRAEAKK